GHVAGSLCLHTGIAVLVRQATAARTGRGRAVAAAVLLPVDVAAARLYRGVHHPMASSAVCCWLPLDDGRMADRAARRTAGRPSE
ncbi:hypothetical protein AB0C31_29225, partial [Actinoplanes philippinensis]